MRHMRRTKPHHGQERLARTGLFLDELQRLVRSNIGAVAVKFFRHPIAPEHRIEIEEVIRGDPFIETHLAGRKRIAREDRAPRNVGRVLIPILPIEMPLPKVPRGITRGLQNLRDSKFLRADRRAGIERTHAIRVPPGHDAGARRRAIEVRRVKAIEAQPALRQLVEVRRLEFGMAVVTRVAPSLIVGHDEHDVRTCRRCSGEGWQSGGEQDEESRFFHSNGGTAILARPRERARGGSFQ